MQPFEINSSSWKTILGNEFLLSLIQFSTMTMLLPERLLLIRPLEVLSGIFDRLILEEAPYTVRIRFQHVHMLLGGRA